MEDDSQRKAVLAAVLAVKRGYIDPEAAVGLLGEIWKDAGAATAGKFSASAATQPGPITPDPVAAPAKKPAAPSAHGLTLELENMLVSERTIATISKMNPSAPVRALTLELENMLAGEISMEGACKKLGLSTGLQAALKSMSMGKPEGTNDARKALLEIARARVEELRARLPVALESRYTVIREFARGGMGRILLAMDNAVGREVALKEVLASHEGTHPDMSFSDPVAVERFLREAKVTGQLDHPNIVPVYEISRREDGGVFYTMKLVRGQSMADALEKIAAEDIPDAHKMAKRLKLLDAFLDVCHAIAYAHSRGVIHRDLKPHNIMVGDFGETMLLDWGIARVRGQEDSVSASVKPGTRRFSRSLISNAGESHTLDGDVLGTPAYMPPEQASGRIEQVDERSDVYSLGAILYEILSGQPPYQGFNPESIVTSVITERPPALRGAAPLAPPDLVSLAEKAMARDRAERIESADALAREIVAFRNGRTLSVYNYSSWELLRRFVLRNKAPVAVAAAAALVVLVLTVIGVSNIRSERDAAEGSLQARLQAEKEREELVKAQAEARKALVDARRQEIQRQRDALVALNPDKVKEKAEQARAGLAAMSLEQRRLNETGRAQVNTVLSTLLDVAAQREVLIRLAQEPVAGQSEEFLSGPELADENAHLLGERLLAVRLAAENGDFALAEMVLAGTKLDETGRKAAARDVTAARAALLEHHAGRIRAILDEVASGARGEIPMESERLAEFFVEVSGYRETQTIVMLERALQPLVEKAMDEKAADWAASERDLARLIFRVLGLMRMGDGAAPVLAGFMDYARDFELFVACGQALCFTRSQLAHEPLMRAWARAGGHSSAWMRVTPYFRLVPDPAAAQPPASAGDFARRGRVRIEKGDIAGGIQDFDNALKIDAGHAEAWMLRGRARAHERKWKEAIDDFVKAASLDEKLPGLYLEMADARWRLGDATNALENCYVAIARSAEQSAARSADESAGYRILGTVEIALGRHADAIKNCTKAIELDRFNMAAYNSRGIAREKVGDLVGALVDYTRVVELDPGSAISYGNRANVRLNSGDARGAIEDYTRAIELEPTLSEAYSNRAYARVKAGDTERAAQDCNRALELDAASGWAHGVRGMLELAGNQAQKAVQDFTHWIDSAPGNAGARYWRATALLALKQNDGAERDFGECFKLDSARVDALAQRAELRRKTKNFVGALDDYDKAIKSGAAQPSPASLHHGRALVYVDARDYVRALQDFDEAIRLEQPGASVYSGRGDARLNLEDMDGAIRDYSEALRQNPGDGWALVNRGVARFNKNLHDEAWADLDEGIRQAPERATGYFYRGRLRIARKPGTDYVGSRPTTDYTEAVADFNAAFQRGMDEPELYYWRGLAQLLSGTAGTDRAILDFDVALRRDDKLFRALRARGEAHLRKRNFELALSDYNAFLEVFPDDLYVVYRRGAVLRSLGRYDEAIRDFTRSMEIDSDKRPVRRLMISALLYKGDHDSALKEANRLVDGDKTLSDNFALRALVHRVRKDWQAAVADYDSAQAVATESMDKLWNHFGLAAAQRELRKNADALANLEKSIQLAKAAGDRGRFPLACALALRSLLQQAEKDRAADMDAAFAHLKAAMESGAIQASRLKIDHDAFALRTDKRFEALVEGK